jgi:hypothetical protein
MRHGDRLRERSPHVQDLATGPDLRPRPRIDPRRGALRPGVRQSRRPSAALAISPGAVREWGRPRPSRIRGCTGPGRSRKVFLIRTTRLSRGNGLSTGKPTMDGSRKRRTKDHARKAWYAQQRQLRFARFLGFPRPATDAPGRTQRGTDSTPFPFAVSGALSVPSLSISTTC